MSLSPLPEQLWHAFARQSRDHAILFLDDAGRLVGWAGAAALIFGYEQEEVLGLAASLIFTPEDVARGLDRQELEVARCDSRSEDERWHVRKDGTRIWVSGSVEALRSAEGQLLGFVKLLRDRTDERMKTEALEHELDAERRKVERTMAFTRTLGHEIRNPLAPLANSAQILQHVSQDPRVHKAAGIVLKQVAALSRMAEDLMNAARVDSGQLELRLELLDLRAVVQAAVDGLAGAARDRGVGLQAMLPESPLPVRIDPARFQQVLLNLLGNAIKYTPQGGNVWCKLTQEGEEVVARIQDTGMGIDPAVLPRIFDLFSRERQAVEREPSGLGVGLSIAHQMVKLHGGTIQARSPGHGKGAEFTVRLPAAQ